MKIARFPRFLALGVSLAAFSLAGCNDTQKAQAAALVTQACVVGADIGVQVAGTTPAGAVIVPFSQIITAATPTACAVLVQSASAAVDAITAAGGTATVKVSTKAPGKSTKRRMLRITRDSVQEITVPPDFGS